MKLTRPTERRLLRAQEVLNRQPDGISSFELEWGITPEERSLLRRYIENNEHNGINVIWAFCVLFPDQAESLKTPDHFFPTNTSDAENLADELILLKLLRPDEFKQYDPEQRTLREDLKVALSAQLQKWTSDKWNHWSTVALKFKSLFPEDPTLLPSADQLAEIREEIAWNDHSRREEHLWSVANFKLLFPNEFSDLRLDQEDLSKLRASVDRIRKTLGTDRDAPYNLIFPLFCAKVLTAERTEINSEGIVVITPPARPLPPPQPLPARDLAA